MSWSEPGRRARNFKDRTGQVVAGLRIESPAPATHVARWHCCCTRCGDEGIYDTNRLRILERKKRDNGCRKCGNQAQGGRS